MALPGYFRTLALDFIVEHFRDNLPFPICMYQSQKISKKLVADGAFDVSECCCGASTFNGDDLIAAHLAKFTGSITRLDQREVVVHGQVRQDIFCRTDIARLRVETTASLPISLSYRPSK